MHWLGRGKQAHFGNAGRRGVKVAARVAPALDDFHN
jgi:hypothetical protein